MPSSTSNSKALAWGKSWLLALVITLLVLGALEIFWCVHGHQPAIVDDQRLWSMERSKIGKSEKEIALLGSSRMETDISTVTLRKLAPQYNIINLSADGTCANAVLNDLAADNNFKGTVICETTSECLMFGNDSALSQQFYVDYYHKVYNFNIKANRIIATFVQKHFTVVDPYLNMIKVTGDLLLKKKLRTPNYVTTHEDRSRSADYTKLDIKTHRATRLRKVEVNYNNLAPGISVQTLTEKVTDLDKAVKKIHERGGKVFFVRFPVSDEHWVIDEQYFPRDKYWDGIVSVTQAQMIHFKDVRGMDIIECPDTSHLDFRDTPAFTTRLMNELNRKNIF